MSDTTLTPEEKRRLLAAILAPSDFDGVRVREGGTVEVDMDPQRKTSLITAIRGALGALAWHPEASQTPAVAFLSRLYVALGSLR